MTDPVADARRQQIRAADPGRSVFVTANAGSGKTSTLVDRVARLLLRRVEPGEILCVTYTKAAAAEMQTRLFEKLGDWAVADDPRLEAELAKLDDSAPGPMSEERLSEARGLFAKALETPGGLKIQTIHAFCEKLLRRFPIEAGLTPGFKVLEDQAAIEASHAAREALARLALAEPDGPIGRAYAWFAVELDWGAFNDLLGLIETQRDALADYGLRIEAGTAPGPHAICGVPPGATPEAVAAELAAGFDADDWLSAAEGMDRGSSTDRDAAARLRQAVASGFEMEAIKPIFLTQAGEIRKRLATKQITPDIASWMDRTAARVVATLDAQRAAKVADDTVKVMTLAHEHGRLYADEKARRGALDFSDLIEATLALLTRQATAAWVLYKLDGGIEHVLIDEAQDTAPAQWSVFRSLTEEFFAGAGRARPPSTIRPDRTVFAVGDEKQSIYSFQGARPEQLRREAQAYDGRVRAVGRDFQEVPLATSFRSTEEVLAFVDRVFDGPEATRALVGDLGETTVHTPARFGQRGSVDLVPLFEDPDREEPVAWNTPVDKEGASSGRKALAKALARDIRRQVAEGSAIHDPKSREGAMRPVRYGDFLVLVRRRDATFEEVIRALKAEGVPVAGADRLKLKAHIVFDDLMALARFALHPDDDLSLAEVLRSPLCDVADFDPADSLWALAGREGRGRLWRELKARAGEHPAWTRARDLFQFAEDSRTLDPFAFFSGVLNRVDDTGRSGRGRILARLGREAEEAIDETLNQVLAAEARGGVDLETCLSLLEVADVEVKREMEAARDEVRVMTVHGAKGLEAPIVILPDTTSKAKPRGPGLMPVALEDGAEAWLMCPGAKGEDCTASADARQARVDRTDAESLRLLYVALTRARERLVVMGRAMKTPKEGFDPGSWWDGVATAFARIAEAAPDQVRALDGGVLRFGVDPGVMAAAQSAGSAETLVPDWARAAVAPQAGARIAAPSRMDEALRIPAPSPLARAAGTGLGRFRRGDLIHRLLERLPDIDAADRAEAARRILARERDLDDEQRAEMIQAAFRVLHDPRFAPVFGPGSRPEAALTGSAPGLPRGVAVSGRIDRLVITPDRVLVVDFKTNRPAPDRIEDADPAYVLQLAVYRAVLGRLYPDRAVEAALVWTDGPRLMPVPGAMMDAALENAR